MKLKANLLAAAALLVLSGHMLAQGVQSEPAPALPSAVLGPDLIAWSQMQTPRPVPQPLPSDQNPRPQQQPTAEIFEGTIAKAGVTYILQVNGGTTYQLDEQDFSSQNGSQNNAKKFDGRQVRVTGNLDANSKRLRIVSLQIIS